MITAETRCSVPPWLGNPCPIHVPPLPPPKAFQEDRDPTQDPPFPDDVTPQP